MRELPTAPPPLAGFTVAVATDLRRHELAQWLDAEGARTIGFRAVRVMPQPDPDAIAAAVRECVAEPVHEVIVSSAFGLRAWLDAARRAGHVDELVIRRPEHSGIDGNADLRRRRILHGHDDIVGSLCLAIRNRERDDGASDGERGARGGARAPDVGWCPPRFWLRWRS